MKFTESFIKTSKSVNSDLESVNARLLIQAGFIHQEIAGVYTLLKLGLRVLNNIEAIVRKEMDKIGFEIIMPSLSSKSNWEQTKRIDSVDVLLKATGANKLSIERNQTEYILNSTHEEIITPLVQKFVKSYKDLPIYVYQIQTKFRNEARAKSGLLRTREFRMKDLYSFHKSEKDLLSFYEKVKEIYKNIFNEVGIGDDTYLTYASGGDFTTGYSHEFQTVLEKGEDTIYLDKKNNIAYNREVTSEEDAEKFHVDFSSLEVVKASEVGNIFPLNTKFSKAFDFTYVNEIGEQMPIYMGSYGIGTSRLIGVIAEKFADEKGLVWPFNIAPYKFHIITLHGDNTVEESSKIYEILGEDNCLLDDQINKSAGEKFNDADLIGCPIQIIVSSKNLAQGVIEIRSRSNKFETFTLALSEIDLIHSKICK